MPPLQENERLLELLGHMDAERSRLACEGRDALAELAALRQGADMESVAAADGAADGACAQQGAQQGGAGQQSIQQQQGGAVQQAVRRQAELEAELAAERRRRQQAEHDFQELLSSMDLLHPAAPSSPPGSTGRAVAGAAQQQQQQQQQGERAGAPQLQAAVAELQRENAALRADLQASRQRFCTAAAASSSLQSIAQGLRSISAGGGNWNIPN